MDVERRPSYLPTNSHTFFSEFLFPSFVSADDPQLGKSPVIHLRGKSFQGALPKNTPKVELVDSFEVTVEKRATEIDQRNLLNRKELDLAADLLQEKLSKLSHIVARPPY